MKTKYLLFVIVIFSCFFFSCNGRIDDVIIKNDSDEKPVPVENNYYRYALDALNAVDRDLRISNSVSYYENQKRDFISYIWGNIFLLYAYSEMFELDNKVGTEKLEECYNNFELYFSPDYKNISGYCNTQIEGGVNPNRFYDENGWTSIGLSEAYKRTSNEKFLEKAKKAYEFVLHGEDDVLGGGIYFKEEFKLEDGRVQKNTICSGVAILSAMNLYEITAENKYLEDAKRISKWTIDNLYHTTWNLFGDAKYVDNGEVRWDIWSYNSGFMIRGWLKMYQVTNDNYYLEIAKKTMEAAEKKWFDSGTGALKDPGYFAFTIIDCFFDFYDLEKDKKWLDKAYLCVDYIHNKLRDMNSRYPEWWDGRDELPLKEYDLRFGTVAAYIFMRAANYFNNMQN